MAEIEENMKNLAAVAILEKDIYQDVLPTWEYPMVTPETEKVLLARSQLVPREESNDDEQELEEYHFSRFQNQWIYLHLFPLENSSVLKQVTCFAVCIMANDFHPEKYSAMCKVFGDIYAKTASGPKLLEAYLSIFVKASFGSANFSSSNYSPRTALLASPLKPLISNLGEDVIFLFSAILTKKRVAVMSDSISSVTEAVRKLPLMVFYRNNWDILMPFCCLDNEIEVEDLKTNRVYCAGFIDEEIREREDLWDVLVDLKNREVKVASHAKKDFQLCQIQHDFKEFLIKVAETEGPDTNLIKDLTMKTQELLKKLSSLRIQDEDENEFLDFPTLQKMGLPPNTDRFLYAVGSAEGMARLN